MHSGLPPHIYIQGDNYGRKNKNFTYWYYRTLVALGFFKEVLLSFLFVGHTQLISSWTKYPSLNFPPNASAYGSLPPRPLFHCRSSFHALPSL
jgi:hypothetical protein